MLLTHAHADHSQGGPACQNHDVEVIAGDATRELLESGTDRELGLEAARREGVYPSDYEFEHFSPNRTLAPSPEDRVAIAGRQFEVVRLRGHAADHVIYLTQGSDRDRRLCFVGDAVHPDGSISLLNVPGSSLSDYRTNIGNLTGRNVDALFPGHGLPLLEDGQEALETAADALAGMSTPSSRT